MTTAEFRPTLSELTSPVASQLGIKEDRLSQIIARTIDSIPYQDREDVVQNLLLKLLESKPRNDCLAFVTCRNYAMDWWIQRKTRSNTVSVDADTTTGDDDGDDEKTLIGSIAFEHDFDSRIDANTLFKKLSPRVKRIVAKRLVGIPITNADGVALRTYIATPKAKAVIASLS